MRIALASLVFVVAACGDDGGVRHLDGGHPIDSPVMMMIDAPVAPQPVTLTVTVDGQPQQDVKVYFLANDGTVISNALTDTSGVASAVMPSGGTVTAINPYTQPQPAGIGTAYDVYTFEGVKPGDHLKLADSFNNGKPNNIQLTFPVDPTAGITGYYIGTDCRSKTVDLTQVSGSSVVTSVSLDPACQATSDFLIVSLDDSNQPVNYFFAPSQTTSNVTVDLSAQTYAATTPKTYAISNLDSTFNNGNAVFQILASTHGTVLQPSDPFTSNVVTTQTPGNFTLNVPNFTGAIDIVGVSGFKSGGFGAQILGAWGPFAATYMTDIATRALNDVITSEPIADPATGHVTWTEETSAVAPDATTLTLTATRGGTQWYWHVAAPHTANTLSFPTLPTDVFDFNIMATDSLDLTNYNDMTFYKFPGGYDAIRANLFNVSDPLALIGSVTGQFAIELVSTLPPPPPSKLKNPSPKALFPHASVGMRRSLPKHATKHR